MFHSDEGIGGIRLNSYQRSTKLLTIVGIGCLFLFLGIGFAAFVGSQSEMDLNTAGTAVVERQVPQIETRPILVAASDIIVGQELLPVMFRIEERDIAQVQGNMYSDPGQVRGQYARLTVRMGSVITNEMVTTVKPINGMTAAIPAGYRAVTISVNALSSVEGWARAGARIDVAWTSRVRNQPALTIIVENALVLSAERITQEQQSNSPGAPIPSTVTLLVSEEDANRIHLASTSGSLSMLLRGDRDVTSGYSAKTVLVSDLLGNTSAENRASRTTAETGEVVIQGLSGSERFNVVNGKLVPIERESIDAAG